MFFLPPRTVGAWREERVWGAFTQGLRPVLGYVALPGLGCAVIITISLDIKKSVLICANLWTKRTQTTDEFYRPQISTD